MHLPIPPDNTLPLPASNTRETLGRLERGLVLAVVLVYLILGWQTRDPIGIGGGDELHYLALSQSLEEGSYRELFTANTPFHTKYPPAYPAWLALVRLTLGGNLDWVRLGNLALVALSLILIYGVARRIAGPVIGLGLILLLALNQGLVQIGGTVMSEPIYLFLSTSALAATFAADGPNRRGALAAVVLAALAFLTRSVGITLFLAVGIWLMFRRPRSGLMASILVGALTIGGWFGFSIMVSREGRAGSTYTGVLTRTLTDPTGFGALAARTWDTAVDYVTRGLPTLLSLPTIPGTPVDNLLWLGVTTVCLVVGLIVLWARWRAAVIYLVLYAGMLLLWPWPVARLLLPVIPLILLAVLLGADRLTRGFPARLRGLALGVLSVLLTFGAVRGVVERYHQTRGCDRADPFRSRLCYTEPTFSMAAMALYLRDHSEPNDIVLTAKTSSVHFLSGRRTEFSGELLRVAGADFASALRTRKIRFVLLVRMEPVETRDLAPALLASCQGLTVEAGSPPYALLIGTSPPGEGAENACVALEDFIRAGREVPAPPAE